METPPATPVTIILVEDNPVDVYTVRWVLTAHDLPYKLQVIENGEDALEVFDQLAAQEVLRAPTLVLLDLNLPQVDGKDVLRHLKAMPHGSDIRVVVVTSSNNPTDRCETLRLGADAYFVKPFHLHDFMHLGDVVKQVAFASPPPVRILPSRCNTGCSLPVGQELAHDAQGMLQDLCGLRKRAFTLPLKQATQHWHIDNAHKLTILMCA